MCVLALLVSLLVCVFFSCGVLLQFCYIAGHAVSKLSLLGTGGRHSRQVHFLLEHAPRAGLAKLVIVGVEEVRVALLFKTHRTERRGEGILVVIIHLETHVVLGGPAGL